MQVFRNIYQFNKKHQKHIVTIGNYDGIHLGHQDILNTVRNLGKLHNLPTTLITFNPNPYEYFHSQACKHYKLMNWRDKLGFFAQYSIDNIIIMPFNKHLANLNAEDFITKILYEKLHAHEIVIGENFRFGKNNLGNVQLLQKYSNKYDFNINAIPLRYYDEQRVSSSYIRELLMQDKITQANQLFGHKYFISGHVIHGDKRGRTIGFPTANIALKDNFLPLSGVYLVKVYGANFIDTSQEYFAMANIGYRPTTNNPQRLLEVHIFNFQQNIYGKIIKIEFLHKIRPEQKFANLSLLKQQLEKDISSALAAIPEFVMF